VTLNSLAKLSAGYIETDPLPNNPNPTRKLASGNAPSATLSDGGPTYPVKQGQPKTTMSLYELRQGVTSCETFIEFVRALAAEREAAEKIERDSPSIYIVDGALNWKNADIASFLYACLDYFDDKPFHRPEQDPSWRMFADFLYFGKIIE
jgi:hypothetical protein